MEMAAWFITNVQVSGGGPGVSMVMKTLEDAENETVLHPTLKLPLSPQGTVRTALRNCPLLDFSKYAYVFQIDGQTKSGLSNVISFNTNFSVNGQSSCDITINNKDFKYNFKYFNDPDHYNLHLKPFFDTNDIIIVRYQKKNTDARQLTGSFVKQKLGTYEDPYLGSENDPLTTIFTGYINDINSSFSFSNGQQIMTIVCTGPSKKLTWTRLLSNNAVGSKDSGSALLPISAFTNPQALDDNNKITLSNEDVVKNVI